MNNTKEKPLTLEDLKKQFKADAIEVEEREKTLEQKLKEQTEERNSRLRALIQGEAIPPNDFVNYLVGSVRETNQNIQACQKEKGELEQRLREITQRLIALNAVQTQALLDIIEWDKSLKGEEK